MNEREVTQKNFLDFETSTIQKVTDKREPQISKPRHCAQNANVDHFLKPYTAQSSLINKLQQTNVLTILCFFMSKWNKKRDRKE